MSDEVKVIPILLEHEVYPDDPSYPFPEGVSTIQEKTDYWMEKDIRAWDEFPGSPNSMWNRDGNTATTMGGIPWRTYKNRGVANSDFETYWRKCHKQRITNFNSSDETKSGFKVFHEVTGYYKIQIANASVLVNQGRRIEQILNLITESKYGLIDPLTLRDAALPLENQNGRIEYYLIGDVSNPSEIGYEVLEAEVAPLILTDTLLYSTIKGYILSEYNSNSNPPIPKNIFSTIMRLGEDNQIFATMRHDIPATQRMIGEITNELMEMESSEVLKMAETYDIEEAQFGDMGELELISKSISLKKLLSLKYENQTTKVQINKWRPPLENLKRGEAWPVSDAGDYIIHMTQNPLEIMFKSSNRAWGNQSCEALQNGYHQGCFDDFKFGNGICMVYRASDILDTQGSLRIDRSKAIGRFMLRWGIGEIGGGNKAPRIGIERLCYSVDENGTSQKVGQAPWINNIGGGLISILTNAGLWDFTSIRTPYRYGGYSDVGGDRNLYINYSNKAFQATKGVGGYGEVERQLDYNTQYNLPYNEMRRIINQDDDEVTLNMAQNPSVWNYDRVIGLFLSKIYALYEDTNRETLVRLLLGHEYANPDLLMSAIETMDIVQPDFRNLAHLDSNLMILFARHPRSSATIHQKIIEMLGEEADKLYASPASLYLSNHNLLGHEAFIFAPENIWQPYVNKLKSIEAKIDTNITTKSKLGGIEIQDSKLLTQLREQPNGGGEWMTDMGEYFGDLIDLPKPTLRTMAAQRELSQSGTKAEIAERIESYEYSQSMIEPMFDTYGEFGEWYLPILDSWAGYYEGGGEYLQEIKDSELGIGYYGSLELAFMLMNQPNIGQENFEWLYSYFSNTITEEVIFTNESEIIKTRIRNMLDGLTNLLTYSFSHQDYYGWELFNGGCPSIKRHKNHIPRTETTLQMALTSSYDSVLVWEDDELNNIHQLYSGCKNSNEVKIFFDFIINQQNNIDLGTNSECLIPMLFLSSLRRANPQKKGLRLIPDSAIPVIFDLLTNNPNGANLYNAVFFNFVKVGSYSFWIEALRGLYGKQIGSMAVGTKTKELNPDVAFTILTRPDILETIDLSYLASQLPNQEDLFYIMEDIVLTTNLGELYNPEGETPFRLLSPDEFESFEVIKTLTNGLTPIASMVEGFMVNPNTPSEILERIVQKPRMGSVGYRRMFDYYGINGNPFEENDEDFETNRLPVLATNPNVKGRLLKYLYDNYSELRERLIINPNIVEARIFNTICEYYPLKVLGNYSITKRAYMRHLRKLLHDMRLTPPSDYNMSFDLFHSTLRQILRSPVIRNNAQSFCEEIESQRSLQFIRAGRCRFSTGLPGAPVGPTEQNISKTGSIIEYPQIPAENIPFSLYRGINVNRGLYNHLQNASYGEVGREEQPFMANLLRKITDMNKGVSWEQEDGSIDSMRQLNLRYNGDDGEINEPAMGGYHEQGGSEENSGSIYFNNRYGTEQGIGLVSLMNIFEHNYIVDDNSEQTEYESQGLYSKANLVGLNFEGEPDKIRSYIMRDSHTKLRTNIERQALLDFVKAMPDKAALKYHNIVEGKYITAKDPDDGYAEIIMNPNLFNTPAIVAILNKGLPSSIPPITAETFGRDISNIAQINNLGFRENGLMWGDRVVQNADSYRVEGSGSAFDGDGNYMGSMSNWLCWQFLRYFFSPSRLRYGAIQIVNGNYDLEQLFGYIEPEYRLNINNFDSQGRFNDRLSAFALDFIYTLSDTQITTFITEDADGDITPDVPQWRMEFNANQLRDMMRYVVENPKLNNSDKIETYKLFFESADNTDTVLFPMISPTRPLNSLGLRPLIEGRDMNYASLFSFSINDQTHFNKAYPPKLANLNKSLFYTMLYMQTLNGRELVGAAGTDVRGERLPSIEQFRNANSILKSNINELMWSPNHTEAQEEEANKLIGLLMSLDVNEEANLNPDSELTPTDAERQQYQIDKNVRVKKEIKEWFGGMSTTRNYISAILPYLIAQYNFNINSTNILTTNTIIKGGNEVSGGRTVQHAQTSDSQEDIITHLFQIMVGGYIERLRDAKVLTWTKFKLMYALLGFEHPYIHLNNIHRTELIAIRDANLPLYIQTMKHFKLRQDEEFIE